MGDNNNSYTDEDVQRLHRRWKKELLDPTTKRAASYEGCQTFEELLTKRLSEIRGAIVPEIAKLDKDLKPDERTERLREIWNAHGEWQLFLVLRELMDHGLENCPSVNKVSGLISEIDLRGAHCFSGRFDGATLSNAHFEWARCTRAQFEGAICTETSFNNATLYEAHFERTDLTLARFDKAHCSKAFFDGADCSLSSFNEAICPNASFRNAKCDNAFFWQANCNGAHFDGANCTRAQFDGAICVGATFEGATCSWATFRTARAFGASFKYAYIKSAHIREMEISSDTDFGIVGEEYKAEKDNSRKNWLDAADANLNVKQRWKADGYYERGNEYQFEEMVCRRKAKKPLKRFLDWLFYYLVAGYGLRFSHSLTTIAIVIVVFGLFFTLCLWDFEFIPNSFLAALAKGFYYSTISFTTLGLGDVQLKSGVLINILICIEAVIGTVLMPLFIVAYARRILQD